MDASAKFNASCGDKTSAAYCPPELARMKYGSTGGINIKASASFDIWSFGVILFELCCGQELFALDIANDELANDSDKTRLCTWHTISDNEMKDVHFHQFEDDVKKAKHL